MNDVVKFFTGFKKGIRDFGHIIATIINSFLLSFVYLIGVGITSIFAKMFKKHFLDIKILDKKETYWENLDMKKKPIEKYYRQF